MHRVNLYGGLFSVAIFNKRFKISRVLYSIVIAGTLSINLALTIAEAWNPAIGVSAAFTSTILAEISALLLCFIIVGSILIRRLRSYFKKNYNKQRSYLLSILLLIIASLCIMCIRYSLEYTYNVSRTDVAPVPHSKSDLPVQVSMAIIVISDLLPIVAHLLLIWMSSKGQTHYLVCGFLYQPQ